MLRSVFRALAVGVLIGLFGCLVIGALACCNVTNLTFVEKTTVPWSYLDLADSSVSVAVLRSDGTPVVGGSGTIVPGGRVLTARHVVEQAAGMKLVVLDDYEVQRSNAVVLTMGPADDPAEDWAILVMETPFGRAAVLPNIGDAMRSRYSRVWAVGYPLWSKACIITEGRFQGKEFGLLRITAPIIYGNSGGGLFASAAGKPVLIGIPVRLHLAGGPISHMALCVDIQELVNRRIL
jgi:S1-C subfamily serine protease